MARVKDMTVGSPMKLTLGFAVPLLFGFAFQQLYSFVDTAIVGRFLGAQALAAVGSTGSLSFLIVGFCMGMCSGFGIPIAQAFGAKDEPSLRRYAANSVYLGAAMSAVMAVVTALACRQFLLWMDTPAEIIDDAVAYISLIFAGIPATVLYNLSGSVLRSLGDSKTPVYFLALASVVNIALDLFFILKCGMGVRGAALATVISQLVSGFGCLMTMKRRFPILRLTKDDWTFRPKLAKELLGMGAPMGLQFSITAIGSVVLQISVNGLGTIAVAAMTASNKLNMLFTCVFDALATTMATFAGQNVGARKLDRISQGLRATSILGMVYCVVAFIAIWLLGKPLIGMFVDASNVEIISKAHQFLMTNAAFYVPLLFVNIVRLAIQGMGFTRLAVFAGVFEMVARTLVGVFLVPAFGYTAACFASPIAWLFADAFLFPSYRKVLKQLRYRMFGAGSTLSSGAREGEESSLPPDAT